MSIDDTSAGNPRSPEMVKLPQFIDTERGTLGVAACGTEVPIAIARAFYLYDLPIDAVRGEHAHRDTHQFVICLAGAIKATLWDQAAELVIPTFAPLAGSGRSRHFRQNNTHVLAHFPSKMSLASWVPPG